MVYDNFPHRHFPVRGPSSVTQLIVEALKFFET